MSQNKTKKTIKNSEEGKDGGASWDYNNTKEGLVKSQQYFGYARRIVKTGHNKQKQNEPRHSLG